MVHQPAPEARALLRRGPRLGVALVPRLGRGELPGEVVAIPTAEPASTRDVLTVHRRTQEDSPALRVTIDAFVRAAPALS